MTSRQIGCQVTTSRSVQRPPFFGQLCHEAEETPLDSQRYLLVADSETRGRS